MFNLFIKKKKQSQPSQPIVNAEPFNPPTEVIRDFIPESLNDDEYNPLDDEQFPKSTNADSDNEEDEYNPLDDDHNTPKKQRKKRITWNKRNENKFVKRYNLGWSEQELASFFDCSIPTVKRMKTVLKSRLKKSNDIARIEKLVDAQKKAVNKFLTAKKKIMPQKEIPIKEMDFDSYLYLNKLLTTEAVDALDKYADKRGISVRDAINNILLETDKFENKSSYIVKYEKPFKGITNGVFHPFNNLEDAEYFIEEDILGINGVKEVDLLKVVSKKRFTIKTHIEEI